MAIKTHLADSAEQRAKQKEYLRRYRSKPEVKAKDAARARQRRKPFLKGWVRTHPVTAADLPAGERQCATCRAIKSTSEFHLKYNPHRKKHYLRLNCKVCERQSRRGQIRLKVSAHDSPMEKFLTLISPEPTTGCWLWIGAMDNKGYGQMFCNRRPNLAHRLAWTFFRGEIPEGLFACHKCDTPACVNPDHLFIGTHDDNMKDMVRKGRAGRK